MSKLIDKLNQVSHDEAQPMGFRAVKVVAKQRILLLASIAGTEQLADNVAGADAAIMSITDPGKGATSLREAQKAAPDIPWGGWLNNTFGEDVKQLYKEGTDFMVFSADNALAILEDKETGKVLEADVSLSEGQLRAISLLPVDSVLINQGQATSLTLRHLIDFQRFSGFLAKPLLARVPPGITPDELVTVWNAGVIGVVIEVSAGSKGRLKELREAIEKLTFPSQRKRREAAAVLSYPLPGAAPAREEEPEEPEEEPEEP